MKRNNLGGLMLCCATALSVICGLAQADAAYSNKWRIELSEGANAPGSMTFRVTPKQGAPIDITAQIKGGRGENGVARDVRDALAAKLSPDRFNVEVDDGEDVLIKKRDGQPDFALELTQSSIPGTRVELDRE
ncbi:MAG: hypothetical protein QM808_00545 [Steroidobacteraceae bacterium]